MHDLTADHLRSLIKYDPATGAFTWRQRTGWTSTAGAAAGTLDARGYIRIGIAGRVYRAHRLAMFYVTGTWPAAEIDHIDGDKSNNKYSNLREASRQKNQQNMRRPHRRGSSGALGVSMHKSTGKWRARIWVSGTNKSLGLFDSKEAASVAYLMAKRQFHEGCTL